jgi:RNA polymerase sigma factor (sigma-70 family)
MEPVGAERCKGERMDEAEAVDRAKAGDIDAYEWLVRRHSAVAVRLATAVSGSVADAEDATQEAFLKAFHAIGTFRSGESLRPWLLRIVANEAKNQRRSAWRRTALVARATAGGGPSVPSPEDCAVADGDARVVLAALASLAERDRLVIGYRYFGGLSELEMAEALGCRPGTVKSRLARALARLRPAVAAAGGGVADD